MPEFVVALGKDIEPAARVVVPIIAGASFGILIVDVGRAIRKFFSR